ncbi:dTDP-4-dehydrorhamnose reductase [Agrobacterium rosae]|uniref:dTDP-4-dehydrorhamnose reductase n=1 Tax=Agrobacterium rosae TaxID=1972867 RepID=UPI000CD92092|nr:dTDP-4-dehydrorhamnose reductase [Agrobacterium rosae]POO52104.1 dTDP-4-dehydrorhamnose reductase [Agrobacterium rosae]
MRIAVTGKHGQVVSSLIERGRLSGLEITALGRPELDLADPDSIRRSLLDAKADVIVSAAAYTAVDKAETDQANVFEVNTRGPASIANFAAEHGIPLVHISTDYVFSGEKPTPYCEDDHPSPTSVYGRSKLAGEDAVAEASPNHVILRTSWVYSPFGNNFLKTMLRLAETQDVVSVVADQHGTPTSALDIADAIIEVSRQLTSTRDPSLRGRFHLSGTGETTWAGFAEVIFERLYTRSGRRSQVKRIPSRDYPTPAKRPANSRLSSKKLANSYGIILPEWEKSTVATVDRLLERKTD